MVITVAMLVSDRERQEKYKRSIEHSISKEMCTPEFRVYTSLKELYSDCVLSGKRADIYLLQASERNFEIMNKVRELDRNCIIIYPARGMEGILQAFESMPMAYVIPQSSNRESSLSEALIKAVRYIGANRNQLRFETKSRVLSYALYDIDYFESRYRLVDIVRRDGSRETINKKLDDIENECILPGFGRCHQSFLVNMESIKCIDKTTKTVYMISGQSVRSSKNLFTDFLNKYREYKGGCSDD